MLKLISFLEIAYFKLILFFFSVFSFQIIFSQYYNYTQDNLSNNFIILGYTVSLLIGSLLALDPVFFSKVSNKTLMLLNFVFFFLAFICLNFTSLYLNIFVLLFSLIPSGFILSRYFSFYSYRLIAISSALGIFLYLILSPVLYDLNNSLLVIMAILPVSICWVIEIKDRKKIGLAIITTFAFFAATYVTKGFDYISYGAKFMPNLAGYERAHPTIKNISLFTDLHTSPGLPAFIITHGSRFSRIVPESLASKFVSPLADTPYVFKKYKNALIIGPAGGLNVSKALINNVDNIKAVDINGEVFQIVNQYLNEKSIYRKPNVRTLATDRRFYLQRSKEKYDLIVLQGVQSGTFNTYYNSALLETYLYTEESILQMYNQLTDDGILFIEEQQKWFNNEHVINSSIINTVAQIAHKNFKPENFSYFTYILNVKNVHFTQQNREFILISKADVKAFDQKIMDSFTGFEIKPGSYTDKYSNVLTDDRPYYLIQSLNTKYVLTLTMILILISLIVRYRFKSNKKDIGVFLNGVNITAFYSVIVTYATITTGDPNLSSVKFYISMSVSALLVYLIYFSKVSFKVFYVIISIFILTLLFFRFELIKFNLFINNDIARYVMTIAVCSALFFITDYIYFRYFKESTEKEKKLLFFYSKLGCLLGVVLSTAIKMFLGLNSLIILITFITFVSIWNLTKINSKPLS